MQLFLHSTFLSSLYFNRKFRTYPFLLSSSWENPFNIRGQKAINFLQFRQFRWLCRRLLCSRNALWGFKQVEFPNPIYRSSAKMENGLEIENGPVGDVEDTIFVAVGKSVEKSKTTLFWALQHFSGKRVCVLHVHQPENTYASGKFVVFMHWELICLLLGSVGNACLGGL